MLPRLTDSASEAPQEPPPAKTPTHPMIDELIGYSDDDECQSNDERLSSFVRLLL